MKQQPFMGNTQFSASPVPFSTTNTVGTSPSFGTNGQFGSNGQNFSTNGGTFIPPTVTQDPWAPVPNTNTNQISSPWMKPGGEQANPFLS